MKNIKLFLDDTEEECLAVGLVRLSAEVAPHEFFFRTNRLNDRNPFRRISDLVKTGIYNDYRHIRYEACHRESKTSYQFIQNKSSETIVKKPQTELFSGEEEINFLLPLHPDADYILKTSDKVCDFSLFLLPENLVFSIQNFSLSPESELFEIIQYYE